LQYFHLATKSILSLEFDTKKPIINLEFDTRKPILSLEFDTIKDDVNYLLVKIIIAFVFSFPAFKSVNFSEEMLGQRL
jgi:hypothetical protein